MLGGAVKVQEGRNEQMLEGRGWETSQIAFAMRITLMWQLFHDFSEVSANRGCLVQEGEDNHDCWWPLAPKPWNLFALQHLVVPLELCGARNQPQLVLFVRASCCHCSKQQRRALYWRRRSSVPLPGAGGSLHWLLNCLNTKGFENYSRAPSTLHFLILFKLACKDNIAHPLLTWRCTPSQIPFKGKDLKE